MWGRKVGLKRHVGGGGWLKTSEYRYIGGGGGLKLLKNRHIIFERSLIAHDEIELKNHLCRHRYYITEKRYQTNVTNFLTFCPPPSNLNFCLRLQVIVNFAVSFPSSNLLLILKLLCWSRIAL